MQKLPKVVESITVSKNGQYLGQYFFKGFTYIQYRERSPFLLGSSCSDGGYIVVLYHRSLKTLFMPYGLAVVSFDLNRKENSFQIVQLQATRRRLNFWSSLTERLGGQFDPVAALKGVKRWEHQLVQAVEALAIELKHPKIAIQPAEKNSWVNARNKSRFKVRYDVTARKLRFELLPFCAGNSWVKDLS